jgi:flavin-binding protein dodecin
VYVFDRRAIAPNHWRCTVAESVYKIIELVGTSTESWEKAAAVAVQRAGGTLRDLRIAEVEKLDLHVEDGKVTQYRAKISSRSSTRRTSECDCSLLSASPATRTMRAEGKERCVSVPGVGAKI